MAKPKPRLPVQPSVNAVLKATGGPQGGDPPEVPLDPPLLPIVVRLVLAAGWAARWTAWWGAGSGPGTYSHAEFVLPAAPGHPDGQTLGARMDRIRVADMVYPAGVQVRPANYEPLKRDTRFIWDSRLGQAVYATARAKVGAAYDREGILRLILGKPPDADGKYFCSCLVTTVLQETGVLPRLSLPGQQITPDALGVALSAAGWRMQEVPC